MKKILILLALVFVAAGMNGQVVFSEDFNQFTAGEPNASASSTDVSAGLDTLTQQPGWTGTKVYQAGGAIKLGTASVLGYIVTPAIDLSGNGGNFVLTFKAMAWNGDAATMKIIVNDGTPTEVSGLGTTTAYEFATFSIPLSGGTATTKIRFEGAQASKGRFFLDDISINVPQSPSIVCSPAALSFGNVEVGETSVKSVNVKGYLLTAGDSVAIAGDENFSVSPAKIANNDILSEEGIDIAVTFAPTAAEEYTGSIAFTSNEIDASLSVTGKGFLAEGVPTLDSLKKLAPAYTGGNAPGTVVYKYTGTAIVTSVQYRGGNDIFLQDETGGILVFDKDKTFTTGISRGDAITGIYGTLTNYFGSIEIVPTTTLFVTSMGNSVTAKDITLDDLGTTDYQHPLQSQYVRIAEARVDATGNFADRGYYKLTKDGSSKDSVLVINDADAPIIGQPIPTIAVDIYGILHFCGQTGISTLNRLAPDDDIYGTGIQNVGSEAAIRLAPNPATDYVLIETGTPMQLDIFNLVGQRVYTERLNAGTNTIATNTMQSGLYIIRLTNTNNKTTRTFKLVVR
ncbi:MAG: T9SS type A sorting domain-containing protein [Bacteroidales bacterium]|jgi:hypothetical protein|nr:T9SS type A sorting domain-containing protein [Bacteroidales bacterium]